MAVMLSALRARCSLPPRRFLVLISVRGWVDPRAKSRLEGSHQLKNPVTTTATEPATFRLVEQFFNQLRYRVPNIMQWGNLKLAWLWPKNESRANSRSIGYVNNGLSSIKYWWAYKLRRPLTIYSQTWTEYTTEYNANYLICETIIAFTFVIVVSLTVLFVNVRLSLRSMTHLVINTSWGI
jgi:hypothetical protein